MNLYLTTTDGIDIVSGGDRETLAFHAMAHRDSAQSLVKKLDVNNSIHRRCRRHRHLRLRRRYRRRSHSTVRGFRDDKIKGQRGDVFGVS